jgi:hypothetical protein
VKRIPNVINGNNSDVIAQLHHLYLQDKTILDLTYGRGKWWSKSRQPDVKHTGDYTLPVLFDQEFDVVVYDPAYVSTSGSAKTTINDFNNRYGLDVASNGVMNVLDDILAGFDINVYPACKVGGLMFVKCQQQVESGRLWDMPRFIKNYVEASGRCVLWDEVVHERGLGPQPLVNPDGTERIWQRTSRACSNLLIFKKVK